MNSIKDWAGTALIVAVLMTLLSPARADEAVPLQPSAHRIVCVGNGMNTANLQCFDTLTHVPVPPPTGVPSTAVIPR